MSKKKTPTEECTRCELLDTAWHALAFHPAIVPPDWEPGNGQSYVEAVLDHLSSQGREEERRTAHEKGWNDAAQYLYDNNGDEWAVLRLANPYRPAPKLPTEKGTIIAPADGHERIEAEEDGMTWSTRESALSWDGKWHGIWRSGDETHIFVSPSSITPGTWKVEA